MKEIILQYNEDGTWGVKPEPYATIEIATEDDFKYLESLIQRDKEKSAKIDREKATEIIMSLPGKELPELFSVFRDVLNSLNISQPEYQCLSAVMAEIKCRCE